MTWRKSVPDPLQHAGRSVALGVGRVTAGLRAQPTFIVIGAQRCGTTSLFRALMSHPQIFRPEMHKGVNYFDLNYYRGRRWYDGHFPLTGLVRQRARAYGPPAVFEASGYYLYHPFAVERIARDLPDVKLVVMLRDPVERAYSAYQHEKARGFEWESFEHAIGLEDERLVGEVDRMRDPTYESFSHRHHSYLNRGHYAAQLEVVLEHFSKDRVHVMVSEEYFADPQLEFQRLARFLELGKAPGLRFERFNARPRQPLEPHLENRLTAHFAPRNAELASLIGRTLPWISSHASAPLAPHGR